MNKRITKRLTKILFFTLLFCLPKTAEAATKLDVYEQMLQNIYNLQLEEANAGKLDIEAAQLLSFINPDGGFPDLDYKSTSQTYWPAQDHLDRLKVLAISYVNPQSSYFENENLYNIIVKMLEKWNIEDPQTTNWYNYDIAAPDRMFTALCVLRFGKLKIPTLVENKAIELMDKASWRPDNDGMSQGRSVNKMDIAFKWMLRSILTKDTYFPKGWNDLNLSFSVSQIYLPVKLSVTEGLQYDYAYMQHGLQLYIGFYGNAYASVFTRTARITQGTQYAATTAQIELLRNYLINTYIPAVRGECILYNALGRAAALKGETSRATGYQNGEPLPTVLKRMSSIDNEYTDIYGAAIKRILGEESADYNLTNYHRHFWRGDYTIAQRKSYTADVRMASVYSCRSENGNGENLQGYFLTEGASQVVVKGDEFKNVYPVWDWARIPGITAPALSTIPRPSIWEKLGMSRFAGGVSDGRYGATVFYYKDYPNLASYNFNINTEAKKGYFFFDDEIVYLGAGVKSTNDNQINTTINQVTLAGDVAINLRNGESNTLPDESVTSSTTISSFHHDNIAYYIPQDNETTISISNKTQSGNWNFVSSNNNDGSNIQQKVFKVWFNHGVKPQAGKYAYIVVPNINSDAETAAYQSVIDNNIEIVANTEQVQAVIHKGLDILSIIFYEPATLVYDGVSIESSEACVLMLKNFSTNTINAFVADPTRYNLTSINIKIKNHAKLGGKEATVSLDNSQAYGGQTKEFVINQNSQEYIHNPVTGVSLNQSAVNMNYGQLKSKLIATVSPANANVKEVYWSSSNNDIVQVSKNGDIIALNNGRAIITATTKEGGFSAESEINVTGIKSSVATADTYLYDGSASSNYGNEKIAVIKKDNATGYNRNGLFKFSIEALDNLTNVENLEAKLSFYTEYGDAEVASVNWVVIPTGSQWDEKTVNWSNAPAANATAIAQLKCILPTDTLYNSSNFAEFNISDYVKSEYTKGMKELSFAISQSDRATAGKGVSHFASKEHDNMFKHPRIYFNSTSGFSALNNQQQPNLNIYPTLATSKLYVCYNENLALVRIYNLNQLMYEDKIPANSDILEINISGFAKGIYIVAVKDMFKKIIKN